MHESITGHDVPARVKAAVLQARDGHGHALRVGSSPDFARVSTTADSLHAPVIQVRARAELQAIAHGALVDALLAQPTLLSPADPPLPALAGTAPRRSMDSLVRVLSSVLLRISATAPVIVLVHDPDLLDPWARGWLADEAAISSSGVVWVLGPTSDVSSPNPHDPDDAPNVPSDTTEQESGRQVAPLTGGELRVARVLAASYVGLTSDDLQALGGIDGPSVHAAVDALRSQGRVSTLHDQHVLVDEPTRTALLGRLPDALVVGLKREVVSLKARQPGLAPVLADAALELVQLGDQEIGDLLAEAMATLAVIDPEAAADYGLAAVAHLDSSSERLGAMVWDLLPLLWRTARRDKARQIVARIFTERGQPEAEAQVLLWLGRLEPSPAEALEHTRAGLALRDISDLTRARLLSVHLRCLSTLGRVTDVDEQLPAALSLAIASGDPDSISRLRTCDAIRNFYRGNFYTAATLTKVAESEWMRSGAPHENRVPEMIWAPHLHAVYGQPQAALERLTTLLEEAPSGRRALSAPLIHAERSQVLLTLGRLEEARDEAIVAAGQWARVWGSEVGVNDRLAAILLAVRVKVAWHRGEAVDLAEVKQVLAKSMPPPGTESAKRLDWYRFLVDDIDGAVGKERLVNPDELDEVPWLDPSDEVMTVRALLMQGYRWPAERQVQRARARTLEDNGRHPLATTIHAHLTGMFEWRQQPLEEALDGWEQLSRPLLTSHARSDLGAKLLEGGRPGGLDLMVQAKEELTALGAHRDARRIHQYLRLRGFHVDQNPTEALTPTEARVAQLAIQTGHTVSRLAQDLSLSPHTVSTHLRHIYLKLGITSRAELSAWADQT